MDRMRSSVSRESRTNHRGDKCDLLLSSTFSDVSLGTSGLYFAGTRCTWPRVYVSSGSSAPRTAAGPIQQPELHPSAAGSTGSVTRRRPTGDGRSTHARLQVVTQLVSFLLFFFFSSPRPRSGSSSCCWLDLQPTISRRKISASSIISTIDQIQ